MIKNVLALFFLLLGFSSYGQRIYVQRLDSNFYCNIKVFGGKEERLILADSGFVQMSKGDNVEIYFTATDNDSMPLVVYGNVNVLIQLLLAPTETVKEIHPCHYKYEFNLLDLPKLKSMHSGTLGFEFYNVRHAYDIKRRKYSSNWITRVIVTD